MVVLRQAPAIAGKKEKGLTAEESAENTEQVERQGK